MIYITGDTHIPIDIHKLNMSNFPEQKEMTKNDYVIICGDFGGVWDSSPEELYWRKWLTEKNFTTLFVDGNHENHAMLNIFGVHNFCDGKVHRICDSVYHLMRGEIFNIEGIRIFVMGGASSHDKQYRKEGVSWWPEELPSVGEYDAALANLENAGWNVDMILSHCAPDSIQAQLAPCCGHDKITNFLERVKQECKYKYWFFGHYHVDTDVDKKHFAVYQRLVLA